MWLLINIFLYVVSVCLFAYAYKYQDKMGGDVILWVIAAFIVCVIASLSSLAQIGFYIMS